MAVFPLITWLLVRGVAEAPAGAPRAAADAAPLRAWEFLAGSLVALCPAAAAGRWRRTRQALAACAAPSAPDLPDTEGSVRPTETRP